MILNFNSFIKDSEVIGSKLIDSFEQNIFERL